MDIYPSAKNITTEKKGHEIFSLLICLLIAFALRFYTFDQKSLWIDEIHTFNDSKDGLQGQMTFYGKNPTYLHPPLFFLLTHLFHPFVKPERDLRIIPLVCGTLSIPMFYFLSRSFSPAIAFPCTLSLALMAFHIYLSQNGRPYSLIMFLGMAGLYFFIKHLKTLRRRYLLFVAFFFALLFHTSYSSIQFIVLSQILWLYRIDHEDRKRNRISSFLFLNGTILLFCIPWLLFILFNYSRQPIMDPLTIQDIGSFPTIILGIFNDWAPHLPLMIISTLLLISFPFFSRNRTNALLLLALFIVPVGSLYLYCIFFNVTQFITSRYFINFLPLFLITLYLSIDALETKFGKLKKSLRLKILFLILFIASNLVILPLYYRSEKQDFRGLVNYLNGELRDGDKIFVKTFTVIPGILHYFKVAPGNRHYMIPYTWKVPGKEFEFRIALTSQNRVFTLYHSNICCAQYVEDGNRLWIVAGKETAEEIKRSFPCVLMGYFDGSFANFRRFPSDASMYLFLWDPKSPDLKGINMPIE